MEGKLRRGGLEARESLRKQLGFIRRSCDLYDAGHLEEAEHIAIRLRILFHETELSTALVQQLGMSLMKLPSSRDPYEPDAESEDEDEPFICHLVRIHAELDPLRLVAVPRLDDACITKTVPLNIWWDGEPLLWQWPEYTRRAHVLSMANKDGAHFDPFLDLQDIQLRTHANHGPDIRAYGSKGEAKYRVHNALPASIRQIAYEVLHARAFIGRYHSLRAMKVQPRI